jgi:SAM-dependent methyltransferase
MTDWIKQIDGYGELVASSFGVGARLGGTYTTNGILYFGQHSRHKLSQINRPESVFGLNQYVWCRWDRLSEKAASAIVARCRLRSIMPCDSEDVSAYAGLKNNYLDSWQKYITVNDRLKTLHRVFKIRNFERCRLLDLGCAGARHFFELAMHGFDPYGIECNPYHFDSLHPWLENRVFFGDALMDTYWFGNDSFDLVTCSAHGHIRFDELPSLFSEVSRVLVHGGIFLLDIPSKPINIGPCLQQDYRLYLRTLKIHGFKPTNWSNSQIVSIAVEKTSRGPSI